MSDMHHPVHDQGPDGQLDGQPIERVDPRDFLDPTARAVAYLDLDDADGARRALAEVSLPRLRRLGEHYDRLSMICFELASPGEHAADLAVVRPDGQPDTSPTAHAHASAPPIVGFEVDDLDDLTHADTTERNLP